MALKIQKEEELALVVAPLVDPGTLDHLEVPLGRLFPGANKARDLQDPLEQIGEPNTIDLSLIEIISETFVEFQGDVFVIGPMYGRFKM
jgi:hypothetical protein